jgi:DNA-binding MarR family transcriptional regulator
MVAMAAGEAAAMADTPEVRSRLENLSVSEHLLSKLKRAQATTRAALDADLGRIGITIPQFLALAHIAEKADVSSAELARRCWVSPQAMTAIVGRLRDAGLIHRVPAAGGGRSLTMRLTDKGAELVKTAFAHGYAIERYILDVLGPDAYEALHRSLDRVADALSEESTVVKTAPWDSYVDEGLAALREHTVPTGD